MSAALIEDLPALTRLALAYAPRSAKPATMALFALDRQLASIARTSSEPMLAQLRYAWWRDAIAQPGGARRKGNPVLGALAAWDERQSALIKLVDGWEALATDDDLLAGATALVASRAQAGAALAALLDHPQSAGAANRACEQWALADIVQNLKPGPERTALQATLIDCSGVVPVLPRDLRTIAMLGAVGRRQARDTNRAAGLVTLLSVIRTGLFGR